MRRQNTQHEQHEGTSDVKYLIRLKANFFGAY